MDTVTDGLWRRWRRWWMALWWPPARLKTPYEHELEVRLHTLEEQLAAARRREQGLILELESTRASLKVREGEVAVLYASMARLKTQVEVGTAEAALRIAQCTETGVQT